MATNTMLQTLNDAASGGLASASNRRQVESFISYGAIAVGDWVAIAGVKAAAPPLPPITGPDAVLYVEEAAAVALGNPQVIGVAITAATGFGERVDVVVAGFVAAANAAAGTAAGAPLTVETVAGIAETAVTGDIHMCGVALDAEAGGTAPVKVYKV